MEPGDPRPDGAALVTARLLARLDAAQLAAWTGKHRTTLARMERGQARVCRATFHLLQILAGALPWRAWRGWRVAGGRLYAPGARHGFTPGDVAGIPFRAQHEIGRAHV